jgi:aryl-alcohol dehydrogenase-like predicted oxidoreductase
MLKRKEFLQMAASAAAAGSVSAAGTIARRKLGKTGLEVSILGLGGAPVGNMPDQKPAVDVVKRCYDLGVNYFDCASAYAYGLSQIRFGLALQGVRDKVVFATKTRNRTYSQAELDLNQSLAALKTDRIDLYQIHNVINDEDIEFIFGPKGVMEMAEKARKAGKIRFIGFTGHSDPEIHNKMIERYDFATVLLPLSVSDGGNFQKSFESETLPLARRKGLGVIAMKTLGAGRLLKEKTASIEECLRYVWSLPVSTAIVGLDDIAHVNQIAAVAASAKPLTAAEMDSLRRRVGPLELARLEPWKFNRYDAPEGPVYRAD